MGSEMCIRDRGFAEAREEAVSIRAQELEVPRIEDADTSILLVRLPEVALVASRMQQLAEILHMHPGYSEVQLMVVRQDGSCAVVTMGDNFRVKKDASLFGDIKAMFGPHSIA